MDELARFPLKPLNELYRLLPGRKTFEHCVFNVKKVASSKNGFIVKAEIPNGTPCPRGILYLLRPGSFVLAYYPKRQEHAELFSAASKKMSRGGWKELFPGAAGVMGVQVYDNFETKVVDCKALFKNAHVQEDVLKKHAGWRRALYSRLFREIRFLPTRVFHQASFFNQDTGKAEKVSTRQLTDFFAAAKQKKFFKETPAEEHLKDVPMVSRMRQARRKR